MRHVVDGLLLSVLENNQQLAEKEKKTENKRISSPRRGIEPRSSA